MSLIYYDPYSEAKIFQCGAKEIKRITRKYPISLVVYTADSNQPKNKEYFKKLFIPCEDKIDYNKQELRYLIRNMNYAVKQVANELAKGNNIISSCQAGLNRSGLLTGLVLKRYYGFSGEDAIHLIQNQRSPFALSNSLFRAILLHNF